MMAGHTSRRLGAKLEHRLCGLCALVAVGCLAYIWRHPRSYLLSGLQVAVPFSIALGLGIYSCRYTSEHSSTAQSQVITKYGWIGALFAAAIGSAELAFYLYSGLPIDMFPDTFLTFLSIGLVSGVVAGKVAAETQPASDDADRERVLVETSWINRLEESPVVAAIVDALAEIEDVDPVDLDPLYAHINPEIFSHLRAPDGAPCQITVYIDDYEIRASSHGTVTVYHTRSDDVGTSSAAPVRT